MALHGAGLALVALKDQRHQKNGSTSEAKTTNTCHQNLL
jgi:hypothetical protein